MSLYEQAFDESWTDLDKESATDRAYAIGVAERLGEDNREELEAILAAVDTTYERSMVELAYKEGRNEAKARARGEAVDGEDLWADLVLDEAITVPEPDPDTFDHREGLPATLAPSQVLERTDLDSTEAMDRPDFLER